MDETIRKNLYLFADFGFIIQWHLESREWNPREMLTLPYRILLPWICQQTYIISFLDTVFQLQVRFGIFKVARSDIFADAVW